MTKLALLQNKLSIVTGVITDFIKDYGKFNCEDTCIYNTRFSYISENDTRILLYFRTDLGDGEYSYTKESLNNDSKNISLLDNSDDIVDMIYHILDMYKNYLLEVGKEINRLNTYITDVLRNNIKLEKGRHFRYASLSLGYNDNENCIVLKVIEKIKNDNNKYFIKLIERDGDVILDANEEYNNMIININQIKNIVFNAIAA